MVGQVSERHDYAVVVEARTAEWVWRVTRAERVAMTGQAPDHQTATRCGLLAATTLQALERIGRRRF
jgi:hypothetical protein